MIVDYQLNVLSDKYAIVRLTKNKTNKKTGLCSEEKHPQYMHKKLCIGNNQPDNITVCHSLTQRLRPKAFSAVLKRGSHPDLVLAPTPKSDGRGW